MTTATLPKVELNDLAESFTFGFGRVVELFETGGFAVKYSHRIEEVYYPADVKNITIHKD